MCSISSSSSSYSYDSETAMNLITVLQHVNKSREIESRILTYPLFIYASNGSLCELRISKNKELPISQKVEAISQMWMLSKRLSIPKDVRTLLFQEFKLFINSTYHDIIRVTSAPETKEKNGLKNRVEFREASIKFYDFETGKIFSQMPFSMSLSIPSTHSFSRQMGESSVCFNSIIDEPELNEDLLTKAFKKPLETLLITIINKGEACRRPSRISGNISFATTNVQGIFHQALNTVSSRIEDGLIPCAVMAFEEFQNVFIDYLKKATDCQDNLLFSTEEIQQFKEYIENEAIMQMVLKNFFLQIIFPSEIYSIINILLQEIRNDHRCIAFEHVSVLTKEQRKVLEKVAYEFAILFGQQLQGVIAQIKNRQLDIPQFRNDLEKILKDSLCDTKKSSNVELVRKLGILIEKTLHIHNFNTSLTE